MVEDLEQRHPERDIVSGVSCAVLPRLAVYEASCQAFGSGSSR